MEFISLEKYSKKEEVKNLKGTKGSKKLEKFKKNKTKSFEDVSDEKIKPKPLRKKIELKKVKNKYKETLMNKKKTKISKKIKRKKKDKEEEEEDEHDEEEKMNETVADEGGDEEEEEEEEEKNNEELEQKRKKELNEKKKNRLYIKLKKNILNEAQVKELHPDIRSIIFPRKKNPRWCWAVFASAEKAEAALKKLSNNSEIIVSKAKLQEKVEMLRQKKIKVITRKKEAKTKLKEMWM